MSTLAYETRIEELLDSSGNNVVIQEGESMNLTGSVTDLAGTTLTSSAVVSFTLTLFDEMSGDIINSRDAADMSSYLDSNGVISIPLQPADAAIVSATLGERELEAHIARLVWTWNDGSAVRTGKAEYRFRVEKAVVAA